MALGSSVPLGNPEYRSAAPTWTLTKKGKCTRQRGFQGNHKGHRTVRSYFANNSGKVRECPYPREEAGRSELGAGNGRDGRWDAKGKLQTPDNVHKVERTRPCGSGRNSLQQPIGAESQDGACAAEGGGRDRAARKTPPSATEHARRARLARRPRLPFQGRGAWRTLCEGSPGTETVQRHDPCRRCAAGHISSRAEPHAHGGEARRGRRAPPGVHAVTRAGAHGLVPATRGPRPGRSGRLWPFADTEDSFWKCGSDGSGVAPAGGRCESRSHVENVDPE